METTGDDILSADVNRMSSLPAANSNNHRETKYVTRSSDLNEPVPVSMFGIFWWLICMDSLLTKACLLLL